MGVKVREKPKGSGIWWVFINHQGKRKAKKVGRDKRIALEAAKKIEAKLVLGDLDIEKDKLDSPNFREYAEIWLSLPHDWKDSTWETYRFNLELHIFPVFGKCSLDQIRRKDLKAFFDQLMAKGMSRSSILYHWSERL